MPRASARAVTLRIAVFLLFASLTATTLPQLVALMRSAVELSRFPLAERRARLFGDYYRVAVDLRDRLPAGESIVVAANGTRTGDIDVAALFHYYFYPRRSVLVYSLIGYRVLQHPPDKILSIDSTRSERFTLIDYPRFRDQQVRADGRVVRIPSDLQLATSFVVPIVGSLDGPAGDLFLTEATIRNPQDEPVRIRFDLRPDVKTAAVTVGPRQTIDYHDLVYQLFAVTGTGWLRVASEEPLETAFWLVNHRPRVAARVPVVETAAQPANRVLRAPPGVRLWIVNTSARDERIRIGNESSTVPRDAMLSREGGSAEPIRIEAPGTVIVFASRKEPSGQTSFYWPEKAP